MLGLAEIFGLGHGLATQGLGLFLTLSYKQLLKDL